MRTGKRTYVGHIQYTEYRLPTRTTLAVCKAIMFSKPLHYEIYSQNEEDCNKCEHKFKCYTS